jgi:hypothetical protein
VSDSGEVTFTFVYRFTSDRCLGFGRLCDLHICCASLDLSIESPRKVEPKNIFAYCFNVFNKITA